MNFNVTVGKKTKWVLVGAAILLAGILLFQVSSHETPTLPAVLGIILMLIGGLLEATMLVTAIYEDFGL